MKIYRWLGVLTLFVFILGLSTCASSNSVATVATSVAATLSSLQTSTAVADLQTTVADLRTTVADLQTSISVSHSLTPASEEFSSGPTDSINTPISNIVLVKENALCLKGPSYIYEAVGSIKAGARVELLGRGKTLVWLVILNPSYNIPCWVKNSYLQIDSNTDLTRLQIINPPLPPMSPTPRKQETIQDTTYPNP